MNDLRQIHKSIELIKMKIPFPSETLQVFRETRLTDTPDERDISVADLLTPFFGTVTPTSTGLLSLLHGSYDYIIGDNHITLKKTAHKRMPKIPEGVTLQKYLDLPEGSSDPSNYQLEPTAKGFLLASRLPEKALMWVTVSQQHVITEAVVPFFFPEGTFGLRCGSRREFFLHGARYQCRVMRDGILFRPAGTQSSTSHKKESE